MLCTKQVLNIPFLDLIWPYRESKPLDIRDEITTLVSVLIKIISGTLLPHGEGSSGHSPSRVSHGGGVVLAMDLKVSSCTVSISELKHIPATYDYSFNLKFFHANMV